MKLKHKLQRLETKLQQLNLKKRYPHYINRWVFRSCFIILLLFILGTVWVDGISINSIYVECPTSSTGCLNPAFEKCDLPICEVEYLMSGEILGSKPSPLFRTTEVLAFLILPIAFAINHIVYLARKKRK